MNKTHLVQVLCLTSAVGLAGCGDEDILNSNAAPVAVIESSESANVIALGSEVNFDGGKSVDPDGSIVAYYWNGSDEADQGKTFSDTFKQPGQKSVSLVVEDNGGKRSAPAIYSLAVFAADEETDITAPVASELPAQGVYSTAQTITLTVTDDTDEGADIKLYYTVDGSAPTTSSSLYAGEVLDAIEPGITIKTLSVDVAGNEKLQTFSYVIGEPVVIESDYYATNPNGMVGKFSSSINVENTNTLSDGFSDWDASMLIAQGVANDDSRAFKGGHEYPVYDTYSLYAAWDDDNLYLGWQFVYVNDVVDPSNNGANEARPTNGDIPQMLVFDIDPTKTSDGALFSGGDIWGDGNGPYKRFAPAMGVDTMMMFSSKAGVGTPALFYSNDSGVFTYEDADLKKFSDAGVVYGAIYGLLPTEVFGINESSWGSYVPSMLLEDAGWIDMVASGHSSTIDTFYEMKIPLTALGIDRAYIENNGIGVMHISTYGLSAVASIPFDMATLDNAKEEYSKDTSSSMEKEDLDNFTSPLARIGKL